MLHTLIHLIFLPQLNYHCFHFSDKETPQRETNRVVDGHRAGTFAEGIFEPRQSDGGSVHRQLPQPAYGSWGYKVGAKKNSHKDKRSFQNKSYEVNFKKIRFFILGGKRSPP